MSRENFLSQKKKKKKKLNFMNDKSENKSDSTVGTFG